jgi:coenzyme PQQ precursor peptide PqqA
VASRELYIILAEFPNPIFGGRIHGHLKVSAETNEFAHVFTEQHAIWCSYIGGVGAMKTWTKPVVAAVEAGFEVTRYLPSTLDVAAKRTCTK